SSRSRGQSRKDTYASHLHGHCALRGGTGRHLAAPGRRRQGRQTGRDRKSTRLNSSHLVISYAVFCLKKKKSCLRFPVLLHRFSSCAPSLAPSSSSPASGSLRHTLPRPAPCLLHPLLSSPSVPPHPPL